MINFQFLIFIECFNFKFLNNYNLIENYKFQIVN